MSEKTISKMLDFFRVRPTCYCGKPAKTLIHWSFSASETFSSCSDPTCFKRAVKNAGYPEDQKLIEDEDYINL